MASERLPFAITMGDPCGIGPEIVAKLFRHRLPAPAFVIGDAGVMRKSASLSAPQLSVVEVDRPTVLEGGLLPVLAVTELPDNLPLGESMHARERRPSPMSRRASAWRFVATLRGW